MSDVSSRVDGGHPDPFADYVRVVANTLGLTDWEIKVRWGDLPDDTLARVHPSYARRSAEIIFGEAFLNSRPEEQRDTVVHELLHLHFSMADELVSDTLPSLLGSPAFKAFENSLDLAMEYAIDAIAVGIGEMGVIPTPPEGE